MTFIIDTPTSIFQPLNLPSHGGCQCAECRWHSLQESAAQQASQQQGEFTALFSGEVNLVLSLLPR